MYNIIRITDIDINKATRNSDACISPEISRIMHALMLSLTAGGPGGPACPGGPGLPFSPCTRMGIVVALEEHIYAWW